MREKKTKGFTVEEVRGQLETLNNLLIYKSGFNDFGSLGAGSERLDLFFVNYDFGTIVASMVLEV